MSTKGNKQTALTKYKIGLANTKDRTELHNRIIDYINSPPKDQSISLLNCSIYAGITESALLNYEASTAENSEIRQLLSLIRDLSKQNLIENGLNKKYDSRLTGRLLEVNHGLKSDPNSLTQNNYLNISPELLNEALALSKKNK